MKRSIGIVILNYNTWQETVKVVGEILQQECAHDLFIQVVDNDSPNGSFFRLKEELAHYANVAVYANAENTGYAKGNNVGLKLLAERNPDYALVMNNDVHFSLSIFDLLIEAYERVEDTGAISPLQYYGTGELNRAPLMLPTFWDDVCDYTFFISKMRYRLLDFKENTPHKDVFKVGRNHGSFIFINYRLFESVGFFSEDTFLFCEERFLARKLADIGKSSYMHLGCSYVHDHSRTIGNEVAFMRQIRLVHNGRKAYTRRFRSCPALKVAILSFMWAYQSTRIRCTSFLRNMFGCKK